MSYGEWVKGAQGPAVPFWAEEANTDKLQMVVGISALLTDIQESN